MKVAILCGGLGTRLSEETVLKPKPMVTVGEKPILWHIMNLYSRHQFNEFVLALGYKADMIKQYFLNYQVLNSDFELDMSTGKTEVVRHYKRDWKIRMVETGQDTMTGGRVLRLKIQPGFDKTFMLTYGDGVTDLDIKKLFEFHKSHGKLCTVTAVRPIARFGGMDLDGDRVTAFKEKPKFGEGWINGGFFVMEPGIFDYLKNDSTILERDPMERLAADKQLMAYKYEGFWHCMDTVRDRQVLEEMWMSKKAPWKTWD
jgi:glucose-1-phosphate cytidylyltransferase